MTRIAPSARRSDKPRHLLRLTLAGLLALSALSVARPAAPVHATFPGGNGRIAFQHGDVIATMNANGTNQTDITVLDPTPTSAAAAGGPSALSPGTYY